MVFIGGSLSLCGLLKKNLEVKIFVVKYFKGFFNVEYLNDKLVIRFCWFYFNNGRYNFKDLLYVY